MSIPLVVLISGKQGSGKTTLATEMAKVFHSRVRGYRIHLINFADPLYEIHNHARGILKDAGIAINYGKKDGNLLQLLGTEWGRNTIDKDIWVNVLKGRIDNAMKMMIGLGQRHVFIIADCRFKNELMAFPKALRIRLECEKEARKARCSMWRENDTHPSEVDLDGFLSQFNLIFDTKLQPVDMCTELAVAQILKM